MLHSNKIFVAGHKGMVGSAIVRKLMAEGYHNILSRSSSELDLRNQRDVNDFFDTENPDYVFLAAARVGGIVANSRYKADFLYNNLMIEANIIQASYKTKVKKLLFLGSSCIYPRLAPQPLKEEYLLTGPLEPTNDAYAIAKIAGIKLCEYYYEQYGCNFISAMPTNLYGPMDNYNLETSHVLPALVRKFAEAKQGNAPSVTIWGTGTPRREFLYVDDLANACIYLMLNYNEKLFVNIGTGEDISIRELAEMIQQISGYEGKLMWDREKPDGTPRILMDVSRMHNLGWMHKVGLREGIKKTISEFAPTFQK